MLSKYEIRKYNLLWKQKYKCWASMKYISIIYYESKKYKCWASMKYMSIINNCYESKNINVEQVWSSKLRMRKLWKIINQDYIVTK